MLAPNSFFLGVLMQKIKVKLLTSIAGHSDEKYDQPDFGYAPGQEVELHPDLAAAWVSSGLAELCVEIEAAVTEAAVMPEVEATVLPTAKPRKSR
jgi:hypothetical protein